MTNTWVKMRSCDPESDAQVHMDWQDKQPFEMVDCNYCEKKIPLNEAIITDYKGVFTGYGCGCHKLD